MPAGIALPFHEPSPSVTAGAPTPFDRVLAHRLQATLTPARVRLQLWDGSQATVDDPIGDLILFDRRALVGLVVNPDLYFGEGYTSGRVIVRGDLGQVLEALSRLSRPGPPSWRERLALRFAPLNDQLASRQNVHHHYDIGNDFYQLWLDRDLVYTCACYPDSASTLEEAQTAKLDLVCRKLRLQPGDTVVETGCGWGALSLHMARHYGVRVKAFNISREQLAYARDRASREGLADRVDFIEDDYRNVRGTFDAFVSVGMLEHVGRRGFDALADVMRRTIKPGNGRALLHFIGRDHPRPLNAWIRRRIFPGGYPPTLTEVIARILEPAGLSVVDVENLRLHYARTLADWRERYERAESTVVDRFGHAFYRAWRLYLAGSEAAFKTGWMQLFQVVCAPTGGTVVHWLRPPHLIGPGDSASADPPTGVGGSSTTTTKSSLRAALRLT
jgi:cyclopropane-fatty-acyl-phospholipid synthase